MRFSEEKKQAIIMYLLEKIEEGNTELSKTVSEVFSVNQNTVHTYINELSDKGIIKRIKRGHYEMIRKEYVYTLKRSAGELDNDIYGYEHCLKEHISDFEDNIKAIWSYTFSEMINNVMDHSLSDTVKVVVVQDYLKTAVLISDNGIGIFKKIKEYFALNTLDDAICELFKGKLTTDADNHSGEGIFFSSKMMDDFWILSSGKIFAINKYDKSDIFDIDNFDLNGTCVCMMLSNYSNKKPQDVFDAYSDYESGFTKTIVPIKNMFDSSPVSRSQARRVCGGLEKFKEVVIDFDGVAWMGQGFAHQIFVVFRKENPDIKLFPINMSEDVTKMYSHVTKT